MLAITPMIGKNDDGSIFTVADATKVAQYAATNKLARLSYWALQRDQVGNGGLNLDSDVNTVNFQFFAAFAGQNGPVPSPSPSPVPSPQPTPTPSPVPTPTPTPVQTGCPNFTVGVSYNQGTVVQYNGLNYTANMYLTNTSSGMNPQSCPCLWTQGGNCNTITPIPTPTPTGVCPTWALNQNYVVGEVVQYLGNDYTCLAANDPADPNWNPASAQSLWQLGGTC